MMCIICFNSPCRCKPKDELYEIKDTILFHPFSKYSQAYFKTSYKSTQYVLDMGIEGKIVSRFDTYAAGAKFGYLFAMNEVKNDPVFSLLKSIAETDVRTEGNNAKSN